MPVIGHVALLMRYPVKSMAGEAVAAAAVGWTGVAGDRQYALVRRGNASRFPWATGRDLSDLVRYQARFEEPERPRTSRVRVTPPGGDAGDLHDPALLATLEAASGLSLDLIQLGRGAHDSMPVSILSTGSMAALEAAHGSSVDPRRFRANIMVECDAPDREWAGRRLRLGEGDAAVELLGTAPAPRCAMVTIDPDTGVRDPSILRTVAGSFGNGFTLYAAVARPGTVRVGDALRLIG